MEKKNGYGCEGLFIANIYQEPHQIEYNQLFFMAYDIEKICNVEDYSTVMFPRNPWHIIPTWNEKKGYHERTHETFLIKNGSYAEGENKHIWLNREGEHIRFLNASNVERIFMIPPYGDLLDAKQQLEACKSILLAANKLQSYSSNESPWIRENLKAVKHFLEIVELQKENFCLDKRYCDEITYERVLDGIERLNKKMR